MGCSRCVWNWCIDRVVRCHKVPLKVVGKQKCCSHVIQIVFRPPGTVVPGGLMLCCGFFLSFFFFLWHFAALYLRDGWGDRPETFTHDRKCAPLDFVGLKLGGQLLFSPFRPQISEIPRPIAAKFCAVTGDRWSFKS